MVIDEALQMLLRNNFDLKYFRLKIIF